MMRFMQVAAGAAVHYRSLGIEVTSLDTARCCGFGNIDGQHGMEGTPEAWRGRAAIDIAAEAPLPPDDTTVVFLRPDLDAVGAAAVLVLRRLGLWDGAGAEARERVRLVAERDSFRPGGPWAPSPLPTEEQPWPVGLAAVSDTRELAAVASICSPRRGDAELPLPERVLVVACWLLWGDGPAAGWMSVQHQVRDIACFCGVEPANGPDVAIVQAEIAAARQRVEASRLALVRAVRESGLARHQRSGALELWCAECGDACTEDGWCGTGSTETCRSTLGRRVAVVRVAQAGALAVGYCLAPVVVAVDQATPGKYTVASWTPAAFDHAAFRQRLNAAEAEAGGSPTWGGAAAITGSPQVPGGSRLTERQVIDAAMVACR